MTRQLRQRGQEDRAALTDGFQLVQTHEQTGQRLRFVHVIVIGEQEGSHDDIRVVMVVAGGGAAENDFVVVCRHGDEVGKGADGLVHVHPLVVEEQRCKDWPRDHDNFLQMVGEDHRREVDGRRWVHVPRSGTAAGSFGSTTRDAPKCHDSETGPEVRCLPS